METPSHKRVKGHAAGQTEKKISGNRRVDSMSTKRATEFERSGSSALLSKAAKRLKDSRKPQKVLIVPQKDLPKGVQAMKSNKVKGTVRNVAGTKRRST